MVAMLDTAFEAAVANYPYARRGLRRGSPRSIMEPGRKIVSGWFVRLLALVVHSLSNFPLPSFSERATDGSVHDFPPLPADPVRPYLEGVAKSLVDRLYGDKGQPGAPHSVPSRTPSKAVRHVLSEKMLDEALQRQANTVDERPEPFQCCPKCGLGSPEG